MARRATVVNQVRSNHINVLLLDGGDVFSLAKNYPRLRAETLFEAMQKMGYDAVNVADGDLSLGVEFFNTLSKKFSVARLSLTLHDSTSGEHAYDPYLIKDFGRFRVAVIGMTASRFFKAEKLDEAGMTAGDEIQALKELLPTVRKKADVVVLMSHLGRSDTLDLFRSRGVRGVDVAIVGHAKDVVKASVEIGDTLVLQSGSKGEYLGRLRLTLDAKGKIAAYEDEMVHLTSDIPDQPWAAAMTMAFRDERLKRSKADRKARKLKEREERSQAEIEKRKELLALPPEEAIKRLPEFVKTRKLY